MAWKQEKKLHIVEGVSGMWHYHLSKTGKSGQPALCGNRQVMSTPLHLSSWGMRGHLNESYCHECEAAANAMDGQPHPSQHSVTMHGITFQEGDKFREVDNRFHRVVEVVGWNVSDGRVQIQHAGRRTWARADRFNGKHGGYARQDTKESTD